jgi:hypothetical protein
MLTCDQAREALALEPTSADQALIEHVAECAPCSAYGRRSQALDTVLRAELRWEVPADLTARLLNIAITPALVYPPPPQPSRRVVTLVYILAVAIVAVSLAVVLQFMGILASQLGVADALTELFAMPSRVIQQLTQSLPESRYALDLLLRVRDQLVWLLLLAIVWVGLDRWSPRNLGNNRVV